MSTLSFLHLGLAKNQTNETQSSNSEVLVLKVFEKLNSYVSTHLVVSSFMLELFSFNQTAPDGCIICTVRDVNINGVLLG